ncbi:MAG: hypothetical protein ACREVW_12275, partial [Burkholderiales bacterium]
AVLAPINGIGRVVHQKTQLGSTLTHCELQLLTAKGGVDKTNPVTLENLESARRMIQSVQ